MKDNVYTVHPIGVIKANTEGFQLHINPPFRNALKELDGFSHIHVLFWCHRVDKDNLRQMTECQKPYRKGPERVGIFATRSPSRPNPIGLTPVMVINIDHQAGIIETPFIDAEKDTPIIDLKPYIPSLDRVRDISSPAWCSHWPQWYEDSAEFDWASEFLFV